MNRTLVNVVAAAAICVLPSLCQDRVPIYRVTVVQRSIDSVNYQYHAGPTKIDFRGTPLLPQAKGDATIESRKGRTEIDAKFEGLSAPQKFGDEYLSYVLWAVTPDGAAHNLGEIVPNGSDHGHLPVTSDFPAFGLIVTAEPYASVRQPSDVVVMENQVRKDTVGEIRPIQVKFDLMPRGAYTWKVPESEMAGMRNAPKVSMPRYQAILQIYEAQNAIGVARTAGAERYAPEVLAKAQADLDSAIQLDASKGHDDRIIQLARGATEIAEDARTMAERGRQEDALIAMRQDTVQAQTAQLEAQAAVQRERERADQAEAQAQMEHEARLRAEAEVRANREKQQEQPVVAIVQTPPAAAPASQDIQAQPADAARAARDLRAQIYQRMNMAVVTRDTPRGLDATLMDPNFSGSQLRPEVMNGLTNLAAAITSHPDLKVIVEGESDTAEGAGLAAQRAAAVAAALMKAGVPAQQITSSGAGVSHPLVSNATEQGKRENRRVEIFVTGDVIGTMPLWDRSYSLPISK